MDKKPLVTIVTPSFNQAPYLEKTIRSVLEQDYPNIEYIIMDGGSTDGSAEIIKKYEDRLAYWESAADKGQTDAINKGFSRAHGEILAWLNSDDILYPHAVQEAVDYLTAHPECGLVYGNCDFIDADGNVIGRFNAKQTDHKKLTQGYVHIPQQAAFWRADLWKQVGPLDDSIYFAMDYDLWVRLAKVSEIRYLPQTVPWAAFRLHADAKTIAEDDRCWPDMLRIHKRNGGSVFSVIYAKYCLRKLLGPVIRWRRRRALSGSRSTVSEQAVKFPGNERPFPESMMSEQESEHPEALPENETGASGPVPESSVPERLKRAGAPYRQRLYMDGQTTWNSFVGLKKLPPEPGWEIAEAGLDLRNGKPCIMQARQKSYGITLSSEDEFTPITYKELSKKAGVEISEENWERFVPEAKRAEFLKLSAPKPPKQVSADDCSYTGEKKLEAFCVRIIQRYGASAAYFRKCGDEYRAFFFTTAVAGSTWMPFDMPPAEAQIEKIFAEGTYGNAYERVLSPHEVSWFLRQHYTKNEKDGDLWNDLYGSTFTETFTKGPSRRESHIGNSEFARRMRDDIRTLAKNGLEISGKTGSSENLRHIPHTERLNRI